jgi:hypothetical protein
MVGVGVAVFLASAAVATDDAVHRARREAFFARLDTPVDAARELAGVPDPTSRVFRFLGVSTGLIGLAALCLIGFAGPGERWTVVAYVAITLALAAALALIRGKTDGAPERVTPSLAAEPDAR